MKAVVVLQSLYQSLATLFAGRSTESWLQEIPHVESVSQRQYFVSHIDDYCDCV